ncbi:hypothetical protein MSAS_48300 [Mycobacterium saskatchewanense]|uniref:Uncharacterized protein n=1 Tax=Mycobacterium saskatchewanense TaxID=220927 RepID=A0AAJ3NTT4_9MYCO|nr:hypothetical protein [Mycobacterium saskatchewanense]ORW74060.1 hypothetical protein AWC23_05995 [Mycobacterium saskatchewanense]BBX65656.1 hypothetical protein MSAS_48300 [Mycobacterium saskatchewanense]
MGEVFLGSEAMVAHALSECELRRWYRKVLRDVYAPRFADPSLEDCIRGAWLWARLLAKRHRGARGVRRLGELLPLVDGGDPPPKESWLRLLFVGAGLPRPATQIPVQDVGGRSGFWTWAGRTTSSHSSTTVTNTAPTAEISP